ncbi:response regulator [Brevibacterium luteolum]|uniref:response regulator n=1 Tax=Brevibacterium luteolum TaxID=199591 RepID=UPI00223AB8ED|nr:response regulator transcription factor [Brevibacterium luteolum]MCT1873170.1 response regulator transcription factor [Brevibacterium luteolum]MCT1891054.1 response regulator transcription factor [Brevibacterium luteolum]MCT1893172.1 response regulator transcription factor [Brevibacterium luteolum]MCT1924423.1 response regulator transcription factor [Brevibacterium luteolum]
MTIVEPYDRIRVIVTDDDAFTRDAIAELLGNDAAISVDSTFSDGAEMLAAVEPLGREAVKNIDVILCDILMPEVGGIEATRRLRAAGVRVPIILLTSFDSEENLIQALAAGANGYLIKTADVVQIRSAIDAVLSGTAVISPDAAGFGATITHEPAASANPAEEMAQLGLTDREEGVLYLLCQGLSNHEIARKLDIREGTVKVHVTSIMRKFNVRSRLELVVEAFNSGIVSPEGVH